MNAERGVKKGNLPIFRWFSGNLATIVLAVSIFSSGAVGLINEYILSTVSSYILGNSIEQFAIIIGIMFLMFGVGSLVQMRLKDTNLIAKFVLIEILIAVVSAFAPISIYWTFAFAWDFLYIVLYGSVMAIAFLIGFEIPVVLRINKRFTSELKTNIAGIIAFEYFGGFVGMWIWVDYLKGTFPLTEVSFIVAGANFVAMLLAFVYFFSKGFVRHGLALTGVLILAASSLVWGYTNNRDWNIELEQQLFDDQIIYIENTRYQHIVITHNKLVDDYRLHINGNVQFSSIDEQIYHENLVHPVMTLVPDHARVLILGGGDGLALREVRKYSDVKSMTLVDLDPRMIEIASTLPVMVELNDGAFSDARVLTKISSAIEHDGVKPVYIRAGEQDPKDDPDVEWVGTIDVVTIDAELFIREIPKSYNVMIIDFPDPNSVELSKLYSKEFYLQVARKLSERGMIAIQSSSPYHAKETFLTIIRTLKAAGFNTLPYHENVPSFGDWGWILAWKSGEPVAHMNERIENIKAFSVETKHLTPDLFRANRIFGKGLLESDSKAINTLMEPVLYEVYLEEGWVIDR